MITAQMVNDLRQKTGAGMMDCKKALTEAEGDMEKAVDILRKRGAAVAAKRAERSANEGIIVTKTSDDKKAAAIVELNCETDFVAKSEDFVAFAKMLADKAFELKAVSADDLAAKLGDLNDKISELVAKVGEKVVVSRAFFGDASDGFVADYIHMGAKLGVLVFFTSDKAVPVDTATSLGKDVAMQVAAMRPLAVSREFVDKDVVEKEIEIYKEIARKEGKPEQILEKIAMGKLDKFYQENCLIDQAFFKDNSKSIADIVAEFGKQNSATVKVKSFLRYNLSDEKK